MVTINPIVAVFTPLQPCDPGASMFRRALITFLTALLLAVGSPAWSDEPKPPAGSQEEIPRLPETEVIGQAAPLPSDAAPGRSILEGTIFSSPAAEGYSADSSTTGTLIDVPNLDVPATVSVVPEQLITDQQAIEMDDLLRDVPGAGKVNDDRRPDAFFLRGFLVTSRDYRKDGFLDPTYTPRDFADVDRVEVIQGPASVLYGAGQPCGSVNLITKNPSDLAMQNVSTTFGSFGLERYQVDSTGAINDDHTLLYRVDAAYQDTGSFRDFGFDERTFVAPAVSWLVDRDTTLTWKAEYNNDRRRYDTGVAAEDGQLVLPISRFLGEPDNDVQHFHDYRQSLVLVHRINDDWAWKIGGSSLFYDAPSSATMPVAFIGPTILGPDTFLRSRQDIGPWDEQYQSAIANLSGKVEGPLGTHNLVFGTEEGWFTSDDFVATQTSPANPATPLPIDGMFPIYGLVPSNLPPAFLFDSQFWQADYGFYGQDLLELNEHWKVLAGVRYDHVDTVFDRSFEPLFGPTRTVQSFDEGSPRVGIVYEPLPDKLSYYAMYAESFDPPTGGPRETTAPLAPELGQTWEGGIKLKPLPGLTLAGAGFYITKENITVDRFDPINLIVVTEQVGRQRSQGAEFERSGPDHSRAGAWWPTTLIPTRSSAIRPIPASTASGPWACLTTWPTSGHATTWCRTSAAPSAWGWG